MNKISKKYLPYDGSKIFWRILQQENRMKKILGTPVIGELSKANNTSTSSIHQLSAAALLPEIYFNAQDQFDRINRFLSNNTAYSKWLTTVEKAQELFNKLDSVKDLDKYYADLDEKKFDKILKEVIANTKQEDLFRKIEQDIEPISKEIDTMSESEKKSLFEQIVNFPDGISSKKIGALLSKKHLQEVYDNFFKFLEGVVLAATIQPEHIQMEYGLLAYVIVIILNVLLMFLSFKTDDAEQDKS